jgi:hypothetical protein
LFAKRVAKRWQCRLKLFFKQGQLRCHDAFFKFNLLGPFANVAQGMVGFDD